jgi:Flp pilus assembly pilin Flp
MLDQTKYKNVQAQLTQKKQKQKGASMIEYALVVAAVVALAAVFFGTDGTISEAMKTKMTSVAGDITGSGASAGTGGTSGTGGTNP